jgi:methanogenic corrinoid protein MtbC1
VITLPAIFGCEVVCGGAALTPEFVEEICGADAWAKDAADGLKKIKGLLKISV